MSVLPKDTDMISVTLPRESWRRIQVSLLALCQCWHDGDAEEQALGTEMLRFPLPVISVAAGHEPSYARLEESVRACYGAPVPEAVIAAARGVVKQIPGDYSRDE